MGEETNTVYLKDDLGAQWDAPLVPNSTYELVLDRSGDRVAVSLNGEYVGETRAFAPEVGARGHRGWWRPQGTGESLLFARIGETGWFAEFRLDDAPLPQAGSIPSASASTGAGQGSSWKRLFDVGSLTLNNCEIQLLPGGNANPLNISRSYEADRVLVGFDLGALSNDLKVRGVGEGLLQDFTMSAGETYAMEVWDYTRRWQQYRILDSSGSEVHTGRSRGEGNYDSRLGSRPLWWTPVRDQVVTLWVDFRQGVAPFYLKDA